MKLTERQKFAMHVAVYYWTGHGRRLAPGWWNVTDQVWSALRRYDKGLRIDRGLR